MVKTKCENCRKWVSNGCHTVNGQQYTWAGCWYNGGKNMGRLEKAIISAFGCPYGLYKPLEKEE
jgi:hypothetical protein